jgi:ParB-like chromosome segregation protein Spo0J
MIEIKLPIIVPLSSLKPNPWNPNKVHQNEFDLLLKNIEKNGFCFPIVVISDGEDEWTGEKQYMIVDGFHRHLAAKHFSMKDVPVVIIEGDRSTLQQATINFNRARGSHGVEAMSKIIAEMVESGLSLSDIGSAMNMDRDETLRLSQNAGIASLYKDVEYNRAWM